MRTLIRVLIVRLRNDIVQHVSIESMDDTKTLIWRMKESFYLVVIIENELLDEECMEYIDEALEVLEQSKYFYSICI